MQPSARRAQPDRDGEAGRAGQRFAFAFAGQRGRRRDLRNRARQQARAAPASVRGAAARAQERATPGQRILFWLAGMRATQRSGAATTRPERMARAMQGAERSRACERGDAARMARRHAAKAQPILPQPASPSGRARSFLPAREPARRAARMAVGDAMKDGLFGCAWSWRRMDTGRAAEELSAARYRGDALLSAASMLVEQVAGQPDDAEAEDGEGNEFDVCVHLVTSFACVGCVGLRLG